MATIKQLESMVGSLSSPGKMPCFGYGLSAHDCGVGSKLRKVAGSVCSTCYACKGNYVFKNVVAAHAKRLDAIKSDLSLWIESMVEMIGRREKSGFFRWHDSGDLQSVDHYNAIRTIAKQLPEIKFWLPTKEMRILCSGKFDRRMTPNLTVRYSLPMIGEKPTAQHQIASWLPTSTVDSGFGFACPASKQGGKCLDCRACWDPKVRNIDYKAH